MKIRGTIDVRYTPRYAIQDETGAVVATARNEIGRDEIVDAFNEAFPWHVYSYVTVVEEFRY
jgi:hypothetical protein